MEDSWWAPGPDGLLINGEEREYFIELLMREEASEKSTAINSGASLPAKKEGTRKDKAAPTKGKKKGKEKTPKGGNGVTARRPVRRRKRGIWEASQAGWHR